MYRERSKFQAKPKLKITPHWRRQEVTGLVVNGKFPTISRVRRDRVRAAIQQLKGLKGSEFQKAVDSIQGRILHVAQFNLRVAARLRSQLRVAKEARN
jgi:hypothetical protein